MGHWCYRGRLLWPVCACTHPLLHRYGGTAALAFVVLVSAVRAGVEDLRRHQQDVRTNASTAHVLLSNGEL